jgi:hypothetical protein
MAFENVVCRRVPKISNEPAGARSSRSTKMAVQTSPKMKWQSRSIHARWADVISGLTTRIARDAPERTALKANSSANVADEQATFMSNA